MTAYQDIPLGGLADQLKAARLQKKLSQRALSERVGIPQSHLSKIENGQVNIQVASLTQIARALDLELLLVPKKVVPAVEALTRSAALVPQGATISTHEPIQIQEARRALEVAQRKAYSLIRSLDSPPEAERLGEMVAYLAQAPLTFELSDRIKGIIDNIHVPTEVINKAVRTHRQTSDLLKQPEISRVLSEAARAADALREIRNALAHGAAPATTRALPAYRLGDEDDDA